MEEKLRCFCWEEGLGMGSGNDNTHWRCAQQKLVIADQDFVTNTRWSKEVRRCRSQCRHCSTTVRRGGCSGKWKKKLSHHYWFAILMSCFKCGPGVWKFVQSQINGSHEQHLRHDCHRRSPWDADITLSVSTICSLGPWTTEKLEMCWSIVCCVLFGIPRYWSASHNDNLRSMVLAHRWCSELLWCKLYCLRELFLDLVNPHRSTQRKMLCLILLTKRKYKKKIKKSKEEIETKSDGEPMNDKTTKRTKESHHNSEGETGCEQPPLTSTATDKHQTHTNKALSTQPARRNIQELRCSKNPKRKGER